MEYAPYAVAAVAMICGLTWFYGRVLYPIPIQFEGPSDDTPEVETKRDQRFRQADGQ